MTSSPVLSRKQAAPQNKLSSKPDLRRQHDENLRVSNGVPLEPAEAAFIELNIDNASEDSQETHRPETAQLGK